MDSTQHPLTTPDQSSKKIPGRVKAALALMIGPTAIIIFTLGAYALINLVLNPTFWPTPDSEGFAPTPIGISIMNVLLFTAGAIGIASWLPAMIVGIILLATHPKQQPAKSDS